MTNDRMQRLVEESDSALESALHEWGPPTDPHTALTHLLGAFDARRRSREAMAIAETTRALTR